MGVLSRLASFIAADPRAQRAALEQRSASAGGLIPSWQANRPTWLPNTIDTHDTGAYRRVPLIFRCIQYLANAAGTAPIRVYEPDADEADDTHALRQLLVQPNPGMGEGRFLSFLAMNMAVCDFVVIEMERDGIGNVIGLWPLRSDWIRPILRNQAPPDWEYRVPGREPVILEAENAIPIPFADTPDQHPTGIGPLVAALREAQITSSIVEFTKAFMDRGALPLYALVPNDDPRIASQWEDQTKVDAFRAAFRSRYQGLNNAVDPLPLVGIKDVKRIGLNFDELAYADLNNRIDAGICQAFGIPPILVSAPVGLERSTFSNTEEARRSFYEDTMTYLWGRIDDAFTRHLLPEFEVRPGWDIHFDTSKIPALQDDKDAAHTRAREDFRAGLVSRHPAQIEAGYETHGADVFLVPFNMVEMPNSNGTRQRSPATIRVEKPRHAEGILEGLYHIELDGNGHQRADFMRLPQGMKDLLGIEGEDPEPRIVTRDGRRYLNERALSDTERESRARIVDTHRTAILMLAEKAEPIVRGYLDEQRGRVVDAVTGQMRNWFSLDDNRDLSLSGSIKEHSTRAIEDIDWQSESDTLLNLLQSWLDTVGEEAFTLAAAEIGLDDSMWNVSNQYLRNLVDMLGRRIVGITEHTRQDVERVVREALLEGTSMPDLADKLRGLYEETYNGRSMTIARTESQTAFNTAATMAYDASGQVREAVLHDNSSHTESYGASDGLSCSQRNGLIVPLSLVSRHISAEHPNGTLAVSPVVVPLEG